MWIPTLQAGAGFPGGPRPAGAVSSPAAVGLLRDRTRRSTRQPGMPPLPPRTPTSTRPSEPEGRVRPVLPALVCAVAALVIMAGLGARMTGTSWDAFAGLNPDERNTTGAVRHSVAALEARGDVSPFATWFDTARSPLNPRVGGARGVVYGDLPHLLGVAAVRGGGAREPADQLRALRLVSVVADSLTVIVVVLIGRCVLRSWTGGLLAAALYAWTPLAIQYAGFFVVDAVMTLACALFLLMLTAGAVRRQPGWIVAAGLAAGAAVACKASALAVLPLALLAAWLALGGTADVRRRAAVTMVVSGATALVAGAAFRVLSPSLFAGPGVFDLALSPVWLDEMRNLLEQISGAQQPPHRWLWIGRPRLVYPASELMRWAFGPALSAAGLIGAIVMLSRRYAPGGYLLAGMVVLAAGYAAHSEVSALRYYLPLLPAWCVMAAGSFAHVPFAQRWPPRAVLGGGMLVLVMGLTIGWGLAMARIHRAPHTRVQASDWLRQVVRPGETITNETAWDEALPWPEAAQLSSSTPAASPIYESLRITDADTPEKLDRMVDVLSRTDWLVVSSRRQQQAMTRLPARFPLTTRYYAALFSGRLCFEPAARFVRPFRVFGVPLDDSDAQESWTAYDHPQVVVFRRQPCFTPAAARALLED